MEWEWEYVDATVLVNSKTYLAFCPFFITANRNRSIHLHTIKKIYIRRRSLLAGPKSHALNRSEHEPDHFIDIDT